MIREIKVHNRAFVEAYWESMVSDPNVAMISIIDSHREPVVDKKYPNTLTVQFDDVEEDGLGLAGKCVRITESQADEIVKFILANDRDDVPKRLVVHCSAGICRSGAVAAFAQEICLSSDIDFFLEHNYHIMPNGFVHKMVSRRHKEAFDGVKYPRRKSKKVS
jgi:protein-tyrosine phosphatase